MKKKQTHENIKPPQIVKDDEIDLLELAKVIWSKRRLILKVTGIFVVIGLFIAFTTPKEFETSCTLIPEATSGQGSLGGSLGGLASLAGVDLGRVSSGANTINTELYRSVANSTPFLLELVDQEYFFQKVGEEISVYEYFVDHSNKSPIMWLIGLPSIILNPIKPTPKAYELNEGDGELLRLTIEKAEILENIKERVNVTIDQDLNLVFISVRMQDPVVAAKITEFTQAYITKFVTDYSISKSREQLEFLKEQYLAKKKQFEEAQIALATFRDRNRNVNTSTAMSEEERLQSEYNVAFNVYNQLAQQLETMKIQVNENTPVFTVLEPVKVPLKQSEPRKKVILVVFILLGIIIGISTVLFRKIFLN